MFNSMDSLSFPRHNGLQKFPTQQKTPLFSVATAKGTVVLESKERIVGKVASEPSLPSNRIPKSSTVTWRSWVNLFDENLLYDYFVEIKGKGLPNFCGKPLINVKDINFGIFYDPEQKKLEDRIECKKLQNGNERKKADIVLHWDEEKSSLSAKRSTECSIPVHYCSHLNDGDEEPLEKGEEVDIYRFEDLHQQLAKEGYLIKFDPRETMIKFKDENKVSVVLRSRTAGCLYQTFV